MGEQPQGPPLRTRVIFRHSLLARSDEEVRVVGDSAELGNWQPADGHVLIRSSGSNKKLWSSKPGILVPLGKQLEYKYVICKAGTGELVIWETKEGNRSVVPTGLRHIIEDDSGEHRTDSLSKDEEDFMASPIWQRTNSVGLAPLMNRKDSRGCLASQAELTHGGVSGSSLSAFDKFQQPDAGYGRQVSMSALPKKDDAEGGAQASRPKESTEVGEGDSVIIVFRMLPVRVEKDEETGEWKVVKVVAGESGVLPFLAHLTQPHVQQAMKYKLTFVGLPGVHVKDEADKVKIREVLAARYCIPVFVEKELADNHLEFCVNFLWPVFHNMKVFDGHHMQPFDESKWKCYQNLNNAYAETIEAKKSAKTLVWVHDYQLLLVPRYLYRRAPDTPVGLFLHCAFPSSEVLSCLPNREEILQGMLSSRVVSFQVFDYLRNFVSCCQLLLGARHTFQKGGIMQIEHENKSVVITADHFVIPYAHLTKKVESDKVQKEVAEIRNKFKGKRIIGSYDKCERFAGLTVKLRLFHQFLVEYSYYRGKVVLVQYVNKDSFSSAESAGIIADLQRLASETNRQFAKPGEPPLVNLIFEENSGRSHRLATLQAMDILLVTSINDGLNLIPFLYYLAHCEDRKGTAIVSEFCGCTRALTGIFKINPFNPQTAMNALDTALGIKEDDRSFRFAQDYSYVSTQAIPKWLDSNLSELKRVRVENTNFQVAGFDACFRPSLKDQTSGFRPIDPAKVAAEYRRAKTRVLLFDAEGTISAKATFKQTAGANVALLKAGTKPDTKVLDCLQTLANDRGNTVVVISGRTPRQMEDWFASVKGLGLCAEHGFHWVDPAKINRPGVASTDKQVGLPWKHLDTGANEEWKMIGIEVMKLYVKRVQGSITEEKYSGISWNYRGVGAQNLVNEVAMELARFLDPNDPQGVLHGYPVKVVCGKGYIEVRRTDVDKGVAAERILRAVQQQLAQPIDFALAIGDDRSDEDMFAAMAKFFDEPHERERCDSNYDGASEPMSPSAISVKSKGLLSSCGSGSMLAERAGSRSHLEEPGSAKSVGERGGITTATTAKRVSIAAPSCKYFTVTVGRKPSQAGTFIRSMDEVTELMTKLASQTVVSQFSRYSSMPTLADMVPDSDEESDGDTEPMQPTSVIGNMGMGMGGNLAMQKREAQIAQRKNSDQDEESRKVGLVRRPSR